MRIRGVERTEVSSPKRRQLPLPYKIPVRIGQFTFSGSDRAGKEAQGQYNESYFLRKEVYPCYC